MIVKGKLIYCKREVKEFKNKKGKTQRGDKEMLYITLADVDLSDENRETLLEAFKDSGEKFTPDWLLDFEGYVNLKTQFELPARILDGNGRTVEVSSIEDAIDDGFAWFKADAGISLNIKEGAIYPVAIKFYSVGEEINSFAEFDEEDE